MTNPNEQPAKRRAFSYTEMMNSGQQRLNTDQLEALEEQAQEGPDKIDTKQTKMP